MKYKKRGGKMDIKTKLLASKFKNNSYFKDLEDYISDRISEGKLDYEKLKYTDEKCHLPIHNPEEISEDYKNGFFERILLCIFGFFKTLFIILFTAAGFFVGSFLFSDTSKFKKFLDRILPPGRFR